MRKLLVILIALCCTTLSYGQQDPLYAQYLNTPMIINPAYAGFSKDLNLALNYRRQWAGFEGNPQTTNFSGHMAMRNNQMGVGLILLQDKVGSSNSTEIEATYGYHLPVSDDARVSFGLQAGFINFKSDYSELIIDPNDPKFTATSVWQPNIGAGVMLSSTKYLLSVSLPKMLQSSTDNFASGLYNRSFYAMAAYMLVISQRIRIRPYALYRSSANSKGSFDVGATLMDPESYAVGVFTRNLNTYGASARLNIGERMRIGYVFELPTNQSAGARYTSHEIQIGFRIRAFLFHDVEAIRNF
jgi:type IX secretion system PorP/SprF family membrane protein